MENEVLKNGTANLIIHCDIPRNFSELLPYIKT